MSNNENVTVIEFDAQGAISQVRDLSGAVEDLQHTAKGLGHALNEAFTIRGMRDYWGTMRKYGKEMTDSILVLQFRMGKLKAAIVDAVMPLASVFMPAINRATKSLITFFHHAGMVLGVLFGGSRYTDHLAENTGNAAKQQEKLKKSVKGTGAALQRSLASFDQIERLQRKSGGGGSIGDGLNQPYKPPSIPKDVLNFAEKLQALMQPLTKIDFTPVQQSFEAFKTALGRFLGDVGSGMEWFWFHVMIPMGKWTIEEGGPAALDLLAQGFQALCRVLEPVQKGMENLLTILAPVGEFIGGVIVSAFRFLQEKLESLGQVFQEKGEKITGILTYLGQIFLQVWNTIQPVLSMALEVFKQVFDGIWQVGERAIGNLIDALHGFLKFISEIFSGQFSEAFRTLGSTVLTIIKNLASNLWEHIKGCADRINGLFNQMEETVFEIFGGMKNTVKGAVNGIIGFINRMISGVVHGINAMTGALNRLHIRVPSWVPLFGGKSLGFSISPISAPQIPYLAKGAVLPANKPFLSVVGDQKHGTNVEAPLETIQSAVAQVMGDLEGGMMAGFQASVSVQKEILEAVLGIEIGDEAIYRAADHYRKKMNIVAGGAVY